MKWWKLALLCSQSLSGQHTATLKSDADIQLTRLFVFIFWTLSISLLSRRSARSGCFAFCQQWNLNFKKGINLKFYIKAICKDVALGAHGWATSAFSVRSIPHLAWPKPRWQSLCALVTVSKQNVINHWLCFHEGSSFMHNLWRQLSGMAWLSTKRQISLFPRRSCKERKKNPEDKAFITPTSGSNIKVTFNITWSINFRIRTERQGETHLCRGVWCAPSVRLMMSSTRSTEDSISLTTSRAPWVQAKWSGVDLSF